jgi:hypothetical protein
MLGGAEGLCQGPGNFRNDYLTPRWRFVVLEADDRIMELLFWLLI